ncbi:Lysophospholipase L1 and related esterases [Magnetospirillum sp. LM-5]|uniref:SGNH/GDSL hydrolase family protein n=1 Tax=Magnetospirillum sp. LM-5 TaxID=2681466 RepID=UPI001381D68E|nr:SGNH/GDSL hydrolase family protein [Magnetospirillum sp. LM-5]CAA7614296.1 Lysophospholipase L1 and related esterases [Magnetospirillum sp. LM-5]
MRHAARIIAVNLGLLLAAIIAAEAVFGTWLIEDPLSRVNIQRNAFVKVDARDLYPGGAVFHFTRDEFGVRGGGGAPHAIDILTIGGSTTEQLYLPDDLTWQSVLSRELKAAGRPVTIANAGIDGQSTIGMLRNFEAWFPHVPGLRPRLVLAYVGINDAYLRPKSTDRLGFSSHFKKLQQNSAVLRLWETALGALNARKAKLNHGRVDWSRVEWSETARFSDTRSAWPDWQPAAYRQRLTDMVAAIRSMGAQAVLVTQRRGDIRQRDGRLEGVVGEDGLTGLDHARLLAEANQVTLEVCGETGAICLDLAAEIDFGDGDFYDFLHNTPNGADKIGRWLAGPLLTLL